MYSGVESSQNHEERFVKWKIIKTTLLKNGKNKYMIIINIIFLTINVISLYTNHGMRIVSHCFPFFV